jgi:putative SOS response-associated peptidase YedK
MPVILPEEYYDAWLSGEAGKEILKPFLADKMTVWPISARVNSPKNDDKGILEPIVAECRQVGRTPGNIVPHRSPR